jgi:hypothetical protein
MTNEQLKEAIVIEATRRWKERGLHFIETLANIAVELTQEGWTPPAAVDPDLVEAQQIFSNSSLTTPIGMTLTGIKRGRALAAAEAKPGMVWVKHDGSTICPVDRDIWVLTKTFGYNPCVNRGKRLAWQSVSFYCVITPPEDK